MKNIMPDFATFLKSWGNFGGPMEDLAQDFIKSKCSAKTYHGIKNHMIKHNACNPALEVLDVIKEAYDIRLCKWSQADVDRDLAMGKV